MEFPVAGGKDAELRARMERLGVKESDLEESFARSSGPGGQNVNKVETLVILKHVPSGLVVRCQRERSQGLNRYLARRQLLDELEARARGAANAAQERAHVERARKRRRSRRAKQRMLEGKHRNAEKKALRRRPDY
jgi:protein subunit release factor B